MRLGVIGLGRIGMLHAETLSAIPQVTSLVVTDPVPGAVERVMSRVPADAVGSPADLIAAGVDGVVIAAATDAHPDLILAAVEAGLPTFCEKPVARDARDAMAVLAAVEDAGVPVQIGYNRRFDTAIQAVRRAVASGELGWVHTLRSTTLDPAPPPPEYIRVSGGIFRDCSVHDFDTVRFVSGREVVEVYATGSARGDEVFAEVGDVATAASILTLDDGAEALISNTRYNGRGYDVRLEVHGSADSVAAGWEDRVPMRSLESDVTFPGGTPHEFFMDRFAAAYRAELAAFTEVVAGTRSTPCAVADAVEVGWIAEACTLSLREHRPVAMDEVRATAPTA